MSDYKRPEQVEDSGRLAAVAFLLLAACALAALAFGG